MQNLANAIKITFLLIFIIRIWEFIFPEYENKIRVTVGDTGAGKTSIEVAKMIRYYKHFDKFIRDKIDKEVISKLNENGYSNLKLPEILATSDTDVILDLKTNLHTNDYKYEDLCVLLDHDLQKELNFNNFLPIGSYCIFDEIANKADCRESMSFSKGQSALMNLHRKGYYNFTFMYPQFEDVDRRIRKSCHEINYIYKRYNIYNPFKKDEILATIWDYSTFTGPKRVQLAESGERPSFVSTIFCWFFGIKKDARRRLYIFFGNIFKHYDSRAEIAYFLKNVYVYKTKTHTNFEYSRKFVDKYCKEHPVFVGMERTRKGRTELLKQAEKERKQAEKEAEKEQKGTDKKKSEKNKKVENTPPKYEQRSFIQ